MYWLAFISIFFVLNCNNNGTNYVGKISGLGKTDADQITIEEDQDVSEIDTNYVEEYTPPIMITGANLTCKTITKNIQSRYIQITCNLENQGLILEEIVLSPFDIDVLDESGENIILDFINQDDGTILIKAVLKESSDIEISLKSIDGNEIENDDSESFTVIIAKDAISATAEEEEQASDSQTSSENLEGDNNSGETESLNCDSIGAAGSWVSVPGNPNYGTNDFCVMKYEAKCSIEDGQNCSQGMIPENPTSIAENRPWVIISQEEAQRECASLGQGYDLTSNTEWMTIATNIANVSSNWSGGVVGNGQLIRGHSDTSPGTACAASSSTAMNVVENDCTNQPSERDDFIEQRTHTLSNGAIIWDFSGNAWEWTNYLNENGKPTPVSSEWNEYIYISGTDIMPLTKLIPQIAIDNNWNSTESIGKYLAGENQSGGALLRGGSFGNATNAGVFAAGLFESPTYSMAHVGFRCTYTP
ncbi:MAG: SUMF1/EgtB/PvdO family nonheme iron enzyme [Oligoflexales bacterium]